MAGWAEYGYCASPSRFFWGLRLYLVCTPTGIPILGALANPKLDEREVLQAMFDVEKDLIAGWPGLLLISDKGFASKEFENDLAMRGIVLLRPSFKREKKRAESAGTSQRTSPSCEAHQHFAGARTEPPTEPASKSARATEQ
ncbi:hypothetical protein [Streptomyces sp. MMBL 11-3]|uniref:hypothetical protein n=1 Tax=Streptomyces sp. MMBL 11-3 TaxID=3382639 RepID=UPI0039B6892C